MKRVAISTLGCKTNQFESAAMIEQLVAAGYHPVAPEEQADIHIINSCTVTAKTDAETRKLIRRARRLNPAARIVATGCYAQVSHGELERMPEVDCLLGNLEKLNIVEHLHKNGQIVSDVSASRTIEPLKLTTFAEHTRAFLQIQSGCNSFCAYCIVPFARGRSRSVPPGEVLAAVGDLTAAGFREIVLTGIHLGVFGLDLSPRTSLTALVKAISDNHLVQRLRIGSIEPNELGDDLISLMASSPVICPHLHLPLQSGSSSVLERMGRGYTSGCIRELVDAVNCSVPDLFTGADIIAGFPGESEAEFEETVQLCRELPIADIHVFPYSSRPGTRAASMPGHLDASVIKTRSAILRDISKVKKRMFQESFTGREIPVLVQSFDSSTGRCRGLSRNYLDISFPGNEDLKNCEVLVRMEDVGTVCLGRLVT